MHSLHTWCVQCADFLQSIVKLLVAVARVLAGIDTDTVDVDIFTQIFYRFTHGLAGRNM